MCSSDLTSHTYHSPSSLASSTYAPLTVHNESSEEQQPDPEPVSAPPSSLASFVLFNTDINKSNGRLSYVHRTGKETLAFFCT